MSYRHGVSVSAPESATPGDEPGVSVGDPSVSRPSHDAVSEAIATEEFVADGDTGDGDTRDGDIADGDTGDVDIADGDTGDGDIADDDIADRGNADDIDDGVGLDRDNADGANVAVRDSAAGEIAGRDNSGGDTRGEDKTNDNSAPGVVGGSGIDGIDSVDGIALADAALADVELTDVVLTDAALTDAVLSDLASTPDSPDAPDVPASLRPPGSPTPADDSTGFQVRLTNFDGPFDLLLQLIGKHKLDVTEVALHKVTDEFIAYIRAMGDDWDLDEASEFLVIAATLLDLKAARLLPSRRSRTRKTSPCWRRGTCCSRGCCSTRRTRRPPPYLARLEATGARRYPRAVALEPQYADALPDLVLGIGPQRLGDARRQGDAPEGRPGRLDRALHMVRVSVREHAAILRDVLMVTGPRTFRALCSDCQSTLEVVARFLALLELYREGLVTFDQVEALGELTVRWTGPTTSDRSRLRRVRGLTRRGGGRAARGARRGRGRRGRARCDGRR